MEEGAVWWEGGVLHETVCLVPWLCGGTVMFSKGDDQLAPDGLSRGLTDLIYDF